MFCSKYFKKVAFLATFFVGHSTDGCETLIGLLCVP